MLIRFFSLLLTGDFSLHIYPVELEDDGTYQCQASPTNDGQPALRSRFARLSVLVPPQKPKILQGDFLVTTEDRELVIECISVAGKPPAEVRNLPVFLRLTASLSTCTSIGLRRGISRGLIAVKASDRDAETLRTSSRRRAGQFRFPADYAPPPPIDFTSRTNGLPFAILTREPDAFFLVFTTVVVKRKCNAGRDESIANY